MLEVALRDGISVLGCGASCAVPLTELAGRFPQSRYTGVLGSADHVRIASDRARKRWLENAQFMPDFVSDSTRRFDCVFLSVVPKATQLWSRLRAIMSVGGVLIYPPTVVAGPSQNQFETIQVLDDPLWNGAELTIARASHG